MCGELVELDFDAVFKDRACFCGSGRLYSNCHKKKRYENPIEIGHDLAKFTHMSGPCPVWVDGEPCGEQTIASHSQQRRGALKEITENGHVVGFSNGPNAKPKRDYELDLVLVSAKKASTFPGLCASHDNLVFRDLENTTLKPVYRTSVRLAERCAFYEAVVHGNGALFLRWLQKVPTYSFPVDMDSQDAEIENMLYYAAYNWKLLRLIGKIEARTSSKKLHYFNAVIDKILPFSATGCFCIENDIEGRKLQSFSKVNHKFSYAQISVTPQSDGTTFFSVSSTNDRDKSASIEFIDSFRRVRSHDLPNAILRTVLNYTENIYFRPSWIKSLRAEQKRKIIDLFDDSTVAEVGVEKPANSIAEPLPVPLEGGTIKASSNIKKRRKN